MREISQWVGYSNVRDTHRLAICQWSQSLPHREGKDQVGS